MDYDQTIAYLYSRLPVFHRTGTAALKPGLDNIITLCRLLNNPQEKFKSVHIAGTNGKGSVAAMLAAVFSAADYKKVGLYTSPHLIDFRERIRINGKMVSRNWVTSFVAHHRGLLEEIAPSFFEWTTAMAFCYFAENEVDIAVIETGLGGRLDSTNIICPLLTIITNVDYDHTDLLGNTLAAIATEKAGIIKPNIPVIIGQTHPETQPVFIQQAARRQAPITFADQEWNCKRIKDKYVYIRHISNVIKEYTIYLELLGNYQLQNLATVVAALAHFPEVSFRAFSKAMIEIRQRSGLRGRMEIIQKSNPLILADVAHNPAGISALIAEIKQYHYQKLHIVLGVSKEKAVAEILACLPKEANYYFVAANLMRALPAAELAAAAQSAGLSLSGNYYDSAAAGFIAAKKSAAYNDLILITGSIFVVAEILSYNENELY